MLEVLTRDIERDIVGVNNSPNEIEVSRKKIFEGIRDKNSANVKFEVLVLVSELKVTGSLLGNEKNGSEFNFSFSTEVNVGERSIIVL